MFGKRKRSEADLGIQEAEIRKGDGAGRPWFRCQIHRQNPHTLLLLFIKLKLKKPRKKCGAFF